MERRLAILCSALGFTGVGLGALGAHGVKAALAGLPDLSQRLAWWDTAAKYHLGHALAVGLVAALAARAPSRLAKAAAWLFAGGTVLFSGSLYVLALTGVKTFARVTPVGGLFFLTGWVLLGVAAWRQPRAPAADAQAR